MQTTDNKSINTKLYDAAYFVESSKKTFPMDQSIAIRPTISSDLIQWGDTHRKFICIEGDSDKIQVYLENDEVITLSKLTAEVQDLYFNCKTALQPENRFKIPLDTSINDYADTLSFGTYVPAEQFSPEEKKQNFMEELKNALTHPDIKYNLVSAFQVIRSEGNLTLQDTFTNAEKILKTLDLQTVQDQDICEILLLNQETIEEVFNLAITKYNNQQYAECQALFFLLTTLKPFEFDLWYRSGIVAQESENFLLAIKAYANAITLNPELIEALFNSIECYLQLGMEQKAKEEYEKAIKLDAGLPPSNERRSFLEEAKSLLG